jgi:hypothetical protein
MFSSTRAIDHALARSWTVMKKYLRDPIRPIWRDDECAENKPLISVAKETYYVSGSCWRVRRWDLHPPESVALPGAHQTSRQERWPSKGSSVFS